MKFHPLCYRCVQICSINHLQYCSRCPWREVWCQRNTDGQPFSPICKKRTGNSHRTKEQFLWCVRFSKITLYGAEIFQVTQHCFKGKRSCVTNISKFHARSEPSPGKKGKLGGLSVSGLLEGIWHCTKLGEWSTNWVIKQNKGVTLMMDRRLCQRMGTKDAC